VNATTYARAFYQDTAPRRRSLTNMRRGVKRNCQWLLDQLHADGFLRTSYSVEQALTLAGQARSRVGVMSPHGHQHNTEHGGNRRRDPLPLRTRLHPGPRAQIADRLPAACRQAEGGIRPPHCHGARAEGLRTISPSSAGKMAAGKTVSRAIGCVHPGSELLVLDSAQRAAGCEAPKGETTRSAGSLCDCWVTRISQ
jgi:hypothetical protein